MKKNVFRITNLNVEEHSVYIKTEMSKEEVSDIIVGLQFYLEDNTKYGTHIFIHEDMVEHLLCNYFNCKLAKKRDIKKSPYYNKRIRFLSEDGWIKINEEREARCGKGYKEYEKPILLLKDTVFLQKLCSHYNNEQMLTEYMPMEMILNSY